MCFYNVKIEQSLESSKVINKAPPVELPKSIGINYWPVKIEQEYKLKDNFCDYPHYKNLEKPGYFDGCFDKVITSCSGHEIDNSRISHDHLRFTKMPPPDNSKCEFQIKMEETMIVKKMLKDNTRELPKSNS